MIVFSLAQFSTLSVLHANSQDSLKLGPTEKATIFQDIQATDLKSITIQTSLDSIFLNRKNNNTYAGIFIYTNKLGKKVERTIKLEARGKSRRLYCDFPPLKISFSGKELLNDDLRKKHKSMKLVTHCKEGYAANQNVLKEFLAYRMYNELTENSLRAQLFKITYQDTNSDNSIEGYAILLEDIDELAERRNSKEVESFGKSFNDFEAENANTLALFQFMIGNVDWKINTQSNLKFIQSTIDNQLKMIPYDFDSSGLVNPEYARPFNHLGLYSMKQRLFRGQFLNKKDREKTIALFNTKKKQIYSSVKQLKLLNIRNRDTVMAYLDMFYGIINNKRPLDKAVPLGNRKPVVSDPTGSISF